MDKVRIAVIGCGSIANHYHMPALKQCQGVEWGTACDIIPERAAEAQEKFGFEKTTANYREVLADPSIDAVFILTKIECHAEISIAAAMAKKDIFMQKAIAYSLAEARKIMDAVKKNDVKMTISFMHRYFDESIKAAEIIKSGVLGELQNIRVRNATKNPESTAASYGGCMMDIGGHGIDFIRSITGEEIIKVLSLNKMGSDAGGYGWDANLNGDELFAVQMYQLSSGVRVIHEIFWSQVSKTERFDAEVYGRKGALYIRNPFLEKKLLLGRARGETLNDIDWEYSEYEKTFFGQRHHELFIDDLRYGKNLSLSCADGFAAIAAIEGARRSMVSGHWETVYKPTDGGGKTV
jgi:predicted dehydrogenase